MRKRGREGEEGEERGRERGGDVSERERGKRERERGGDVSERERGRGHE